MASQNERATATEQAQTAGLVEIMEGRAAMYDFLARAYQNEVDEAFLNELRTMHYPQNSDNPKINDAFKRIYRVVRHAREDLLDVLSVDYARTFLGSGVLNPNAAFPYESVYTSKHALVMQEARDEVLAIYRSQGITKDASWKDPEDHIALQLQFQSTLCRRIAEALTAGDDDRARELVRTQYGFLVHHMLDWIPNFCIDVPRYARNDFYCAFAQLTAEFLDQERELLEDIATASAIDLKEVEAVA